MAARRLLLLALLVGAGVLPAAPLATPALAATPGVPQAWGANALGQLGDGTTSPHATPSGVNSLNLSNAVAVAAGHTHALALRPDGTLAAWGSNNNGELGFDTAGETCFDMVNNGACSKTPTILGAPSGIVAIAAGYDIAGTRGPFSLALGADGYVWAWGGNQLGQLGNGCTVAVNCTDVTTPTQVKGPGNTGTLGNAIAISAGKAHALAVLADGTVFGWGNNGAHQLGGGAHATETAPVQMVGQNGVGAMQGALAAAAGGDHTLVLKADGTVWAVGMNNDGQLGDGSNMDRATPVPVKDAAGTGVLSNVVAVAAGNAHSIALDASGRVWAWGANNFAQLGNGTASGNSLLPTQVRDTAGSGFLTGITAIARGKNHTLALKADGTAWIWGDRASGNTPVQVGGLAGITALAGGTDFDLALTAASLSVSGPSGTPPTILSGTNVTATWTNAVSPSASNTIGLFPLAAPSSAPRAQIGTTGGASDSQVFPIPLAIQPGTYEPRLLSPSGVPLARSTRFLVVASPVSGRPWTAGASSFGQLGDNCAAGSTCADRAVPDLMYRLADVTAIAASASGNHSLALDSIGRVWAWGSNSSGQLGSACAVGLSCSVASQVGGLVGPFVAVAAGGQLNASPARSHSLALHADHTLWAWGANNLGQLGNGCALPCAGSPTPVQVKDPTGMGVLTNIVAIAAGRAHSLALRGDGAVFAWGANGDGQLGNHAPGDSSLPVQVWAGSGGCCLSGASGIAAGSEHSLAVVGGGVRAWGANFDGQLGSGATGGGSDTPLAVSGLGGVTTVAAGNNFSLALADGGVYGWGLNSSGQLGNACTLMVDCTDVPTPTRVHGPGGVGFLDSVDTITAGQFFSLAVRHDSTAWAWGANGSGQLGDGSTTSRTAPVQVYGLTGLTAAAGGSAHSVLLTSASAPASPTPTPTPTRTATATPTATWTATPTATPSATATRTATAFATTTASPTPPSVATPSASPTSPPGPPCTPRTSVGVQTTPNGDGRLRVVLTASSNASTPTNTLQAVQIMRLTNASVQIGSQGGVTGSYAVVPPAPSLTLLVSRPAAGASTVELTVTDACGAWPTFVGGGPSAF